MKSGIQLLFLLLILIFTISVEGQEHASLLNDDLISWTDKGFCGSIDFRETNIAGEAVYLNGVNLMWLHRHWVAAGLAFYSMNQMYAVQKQLCEFSYGGPYVQIMIRPERLIFLSIGASGGINYQKYLGGRNETLFYIEPEAKIWLNVSSFMRVSFLTAYRFVQNKTASIETSGRILGFSITYGKF